MECFSTEMHKNFINAVAKDQIAPLSVEHRTRERLCKAEAYKTTETYEFMPFLVDISS